MRIATIIQTFPSNRSYSFVRLSALAKNGQEVRIYYRAKGECGGEFHPFEQQMQADGVRALWFRSRIALIFPSIGAIRYVRNAVRSGVGFIRALRYFRRVSKIVHWQPEIIHIEEYFNARQLLELLRHAGVPIVISFRGDDICHKPKSDSELLEWYQSTSKIEKLGFHCISDYVRKCAMREGIAADRLTTIYQGVGHISKPQNGRLPGERINLVLVARFSFEKGIDVALEAMRTVVSAHSEVTLHLFGEGEQLAVYQRHYENEGFFDRVQFHGEVEHRAMCEWLQANSAATIGLQPSRREGLGQAILELMAYGIPVVASDVGGIPEIIENNINGILVEPEDPQALATAILSLMKDPILAARMGEQAFERANHFTGIIEGERFKKYYSELIDRYAD